MPSIIVQAHIPADGEGPLTLVERAVPVELHDDHYTAQLLERVRWALVDAERLESARLPMHAGADGEIAGG